MSVILGTIIGEQRVFGRMSGIARSIYEYSPNFSIAGYILFFIIFILCAIVYQLGFAKKGLKKWQISVIYSFLFVGCLFLTFLAFFLPMVEGLLVTTLVLVVYRLRLKREKISRAQAESKEE